jgi:hypothetical protein
MEHDTNILVLNDKAWGSNTANSYKKPNETKGTFMPWINPDYEHFGYNLTDEIHWEATNNSVWLRGRVDLWLVDPNTPMYPPLSVRIMLNIVNKNLWKNKRDFQS